MSQDQKIAERWILLKAAEIYCIGGTAGEVRTQSSDDYRVQPSFYGPNISTTLSFTVCC